MSFNSDRLKEVLKGFAGKRILVVGDLMLDHYVETVAKRLSREAPIPVSDVTAENSFAGGAGNLASNLVSLGAKVSAVGMIGNDYEGELVRSILAKQGVDTEGMHIWSRPTLLKTRYFLDDTQHFRIDRESRDDVDRNLTAELVKSVESKAGSVDCIAVSDYDKGTVSPLLLSIIAKVAREHNIPAFGQPKTRHYLDFIGFDFVKSNIREASRVTGISILNETGLHNLGIHLLRRLRCEALMLTRGAHGLLIFEGEKMTQLPAISTSTEFRKIIGIRDSMMSVLTLSLNAGASITEASTLCNIVPYISRPGPETTVVSTKSLEEYLYEGKTPEQAVTKTLYR